jgi:integrase
MAVNKIFNEADINELLEKNALGFLGVRNAALIMGGVCWGLTPSELCLVTIKDVINADGRFLPSWEIPSGSAHNGEARVLYTSKQLVDYLEKYIEFRVINQWGVSGDSHYRHMNPDSALFLNDQGEPYKLTKRKSNPKSSQPRSMNEQLKRMVGRTNIIGATPASFRDSYIKNMFDKGCNLRVIMQSSGIKQKRTLENKVRPLERDIEDVLEDLFAHVKMPECLILSNSGK